MTKAFSLSLSLSVISRGCRSSRAEEVSEVELRTPNSAQQVEGSECERNRRDTRHSDATPQKYAEKCHREEECPPFTNEQ